MASDAYDAEDPGQLQDEVENASGEGGYDGSECFEDNAEHGWTGESDQNWMRNNQSSQSKSRGSRTTSGKADGTESRTLGHNKHGKPARIGAKRKETKERNKPPKNSKRSISSSRHDWLANQARLETFSIWSEEAAQRNAEMVSRRLPIVCHSKINLVTQPPAHRPRSL